MKKTKRHNTQFVSYMILLVTLLLLAILSIMLYKHKSIEAELNSVIDLLTRMDNAIAELDSYFEIILCIFALYIAKCQLPIPLAFLMVITGMVFPIGPALAMNAFFLFFFFTVKYIEGIFIGGGWAGMILSIKKIRFVRDWIHFKGNGNPYILFVSRFIPGIPLGMVSKYYGSMRYDFLYYTLLSLGGFLPRLYIYTKLGSSWTNPFSAQFIILLMVLVGFTGFSSFIFNIFYGIRSRKMTQTLLIYSEKNKYRIVL